MMFSVYLLFNTDVVVRTVRYQTRFVFARLSVCLPACVHVYLSVCLSVCLSVYLSLWGECTGMSGRGCVHDGMAHVRVSCTGG